MVRVRENTIETKGIKLENVEWLKEKENLKNKWK